MQRERDYQIEGIEYHCLITYKRMKNLVLRVRSLEEHTIAVSSPHYVTLKQIDKFVNENLPSLIKRMEKRQSKGQEEPGFTHFLGQKTFVGENMEEARKLIKEKALSIFSSRVAYFAPLMGIPEDYYKVRVRDIKTRFGVNSKKTRTLTFQLGLLQYALPTIDSVIVHELAHHYHFDHSKAFYDVVLKYCPDYWKYRKKLLEKDYE